MIDRNVGEYCKDTGAPHRWEQYTRNGLLVIDCECGAEAARFVTEWALELARTPVNIEFPSRVWCDDEDDKAPWLEVTPRL